ncbi:hydroxypyruvate isomerase family protein [Pontibacter chitinilyticus]|uniref:hydroxypyruvate isomerase family protein n=1 Tax=Pontibacter chitinilyticus TaxID=2674989 RepID=UPI00321BB07C
MRRSDFLKTSLLAGIALSSGASAFANTCSAKPKAGKPFSLNYAPHFGMFNSLAGDDLIKQLQFMYEQGFRAIEDNGMMGRPVSEQEKIGKELTRLGMTMGVFVLDKGGNAQNSLAAGKPEYVDIFLDGCKRAVDVAKRVNAKWVTVVPGDFERKLPVGIQTGNVIEALRRGVEILAPHGITMVLEPLSDTPDLFLRNSDQTYTICKAVNSPNCKLLFDIYHMQRNEGNLIANMDRNWDEIAYIQIGDNPGRNEPTTGEINFKNIFKFLHEKGYKGVLGMEHGMAGKGKEGELALIQAYRQVDNFA